MNELKGKFCPVARCQCKGDRCVFYTASSKFGVERCVLVRD